MQFAAGFSPCDRPQLQLPDGGETGGRAGMFPTVSHGPLSARGPTLKQEGFFVCLFVCLKKKRFFRVIHCPLVSMY